MNEHTSESNEILVNGFEYLESIGKPKKILKNIFDNLFCKKFEIINIDYNTLKIITPFKDSSNDLIQFFIQTHLIDKKIKITDDGYITHYFNIRNLDISYVKKIVKNYNLIFNSDEIFTLIDFSENNLISEKINDLIQIMILLLNSEEFL